MTMQQYNDLVQIAQGHFEPKEVAQETQNALDGKPVAVSMPSEEEFARRMEEEEGSPIPPPRTLAFQLKRTFNLESDDPLLVSMSGEILKFPEDGQDEQSILQRKTSKSYQSSKLLEARLEKLQKLKERAKKASHQRRMKDFKAMQKQVEELGEERLALEKELQNIPADIGFQVADMRRNRMENQNDHGGIQSGGSLIMRKGKLVRGVRVGEVKKGTPASLVLKPRDIILSANDTPTPAPAALLRILHPDKPLLAGHPIVLNVLRQFRHVEFADSDDDEEYEGDGGLGASKREVYDPHSDGGARDARWRELRLSIEVGSQSRSIEDIRTIRRRIPEIRREVHELQVRRRLLLAIRDKEAKEAAWKASPEYKKMMEEKEKERQKQLRLEKAREMAIEKASKSARDQSTLESGELGATGEPEKDSPGNVEAPLSVNSSTKSDLQKALLEARPFFDRKRSLLNPSSLQSTENVSSSTAPAENAENTAVKQPINLKIDVNADSVPVNVDVPDTIPSEVVATPETPSSASTKGQSAEP